MGRLSVWVLISSLAACAPRAPVATAPAPPKAAEPEQVRLCATTVLEHDQHRCQWLLTPEQQRRRAQSQRLVLRDGKLLRSDAISGSGAPLYDGLSSIYEHRGERVAHWSLENLNGVVKGRNVVSDDGAWVRWLDEQDRPRVRAQTRISGERRTLNASGRVASLASVNARGEPEPDRGVSETRLKYDSSGAVVETTSHGAQGEPVNGPEGAHRVAYVVDARGLVLEQRYFDAQGRPTLVDGAHLLRSTYDAFGNLATTSYYDARERPTQSEGEGAVALRYVRDERGNEIARERQDQQGRPLAGKGGWATRKVRYDERDLAVATGYFDAQGRPVSEEKLGASSLRQVRSERGNVLSEQLFDERGEPTLGVDGYHRVDVQYDERDNPTAFTYASAGGLRIGSRQLYYDGDRLIREECRDSSGAPSATQKGYASFEISWEADGSEGAKRFFDAAGEQRLSCSGSAPAALQSELAERAASLRSCYQRLLRYGSTAEGRLLVEVTIGGSGQVLKAKLAQDEIDDADLSKCALTTMRAPYVSHAEGDCVTVRVPLTFRAQR